MRKPPDDGADKPVSRRRGHHGSPSGSHRGGTQSSQRGSSTSGQRTASPGGQRGAAPRADRAGESSVFVPGYDSQREPGPERHTPGQGGAATPWHGSAAGGAAGKGPVRGYPPLPGQPLPMYPPGQFAAWNRGPGSQARTSGGASTPEPGLEPPAARHGGQSPEAGRPSGSGYYGQDEPGYSMLAVSDPAADVTSTQTWQAVGDGRATGTWTAPAMTGDPRSPAPAAGPARTAPDRAPGQADLGPGGTGPADVGLLPGSRRPTAPQPPPEAGSGPQSRPAIQGRRLAPWSPQAAAQRAASPDAPDWADLRAGGAPRGAAPAAGEATAPVASGPVAPAAHGPPAAAPGSRRAARGGKVSQGTQRPAAQRKGRRRKYPRSAILGALVLVLAAGSALYLGARLISSPSHPNAGGQAKPAVTPTPTPTPTPTLGPFGHIGSRQADPQPLTIAQLYPVRFALGGASFTRTATRLGKNCVGAVVGSSVQSAVRSSSCTQAARASYLSAAGKMMGTIGVLNLKTAKDATKAARAAGSSNFVAQLPGRKGPTKKLGHGTGIEEALAKGHYLILIWAELTDLRRPNTTAQRSGLEKFMTQLLHSTVNLSLSNRMVNGTPS